MSKETNKKEDNPLIYNMLLVPNGLTLEDLWTIAEKANIVLYDSSMWEEDQTPPFYKLGQKKDGKKIIDISNKK